MKKHILLFTALICLSYSQAQDIPQSSVPSIILSRFNLNFPEAQDIEWEMKGTLYNVEFETGWNTDHEAWYSTDGKLVKHKEDINAGDLPESVSKRIVKDFEGYSTEELQRITKGKEVVYDVELESYLHQDLEIIFSATGDVLSKMVD